MTCVVLVPVLGRPERATPLAQSLHGASPDASLMFLCSPGDTDQIAVCKTLGWTVEVEWEPDGGDYARKMNHGYQLAIAHSFSWVLLGADDLRFHPGWLDAALQCATATGACVVGTNDLGNSKVMRGEHSTHTLVSARYAECGTIDEPGKLLHEGYDHNYVDNEFIGTAMHRQTFAFAADSHVEHLHPFWQKGVADATYAKGQRRFGEDRALYVSRMHLWAGSE